MKRKLRAVLDDTIRNVIRDDRRDHRARIALAIAFILVGFALGSSHVIVIGVLALTLVARHRHIAVEYELDEMINQPLPPPRRGVRPPSG